MLIDHPQPYHPLFMVMTGVWFMALFYPHCISFYYISYPIINGDVLVI